MKIYYIKLLKREVSDFIRFSMKYNIQIYFTWYEESFLDSFYVVTCTDQADNKITTEEKARLILESYGTKIFNSENL